MRDGVIHELPTLQLNHHQRTRPEDNARLSYVRCCACKRLFNERTGTPFNFLDYPSDVVLLVVLWRLRYTLSLRALSEMFLERGMVFTYETVREWEARFAPLITDQFLSSDRALPG